MKKCSSCFLASLLLMFFSTPLGKVTDETDENVRQDGKKARKEVKSVVIPSFHSSFCC